MGEARRRKQQLGQAYGQKQQPLTSNRLKEVHLTKFVKESSETVNQILENQIENATDATLQEYFENTHSQLVNTMRTWLDNYLASYQPQDQKFLASTYINGLLGIFDEATEMEKGNMAFSLPVVTEASQAYLDDEVAASVARFQEYITTFHQMLIKDEQAELAAEENAEFE
jgi:hypothetical protein